jgi:hypothetical protein
VCHILSFWTREVVNRAALKPWVVHNITLAMNTSGPKIYTMVVTMCRICFSVGRTHVQLNASAIMAVRKAPLTLGG